MNFISKQNLAEKEKFKRRFQGNYNPFEHVLNPLQGSNTNNTSKVLQILNEINENKPTITTPGIEETSSK